MGPSIHPWPIEWLADPRGSIAESPALRWLVHCDVLGARCPWNELHEDFLQRWGRNTVVRLVHVEARWSIIRKTLHTDDRHVQPAFSRFPVGERLVNERDAILRLAEDDVAPVLLAWSSRSPMQNSTLWMTDAGTEATTTNASLQHVQQVEHILPTLRTRGLHAEEIHRRQFLQGADGKTRMVGLGHLGRAEQTRTQFPGYRCAASFLMACIHTCACSHARMRMQTYTHAGIHACMRACVHTGARRAS